MRLSHLTDKTLLKDTKNLVLHERRVSVEILHHLKEIDVRKLYADLKWSSLFDYCVRELGYSESSAQRRIVAARLMGEMPEVGPKIETGALTLTNISQVQKFFKDPEKKREVLQEVEGLSKKECEKKLFEISGVEISAKETRKRISETKVKVAIVLSDETIQAMEKVKSLLGKELSSDELIQFMAEAAIQKIEKEKFKQTKSKGSLPLAKVRRTPSAKVKREVYLRDKKCSNCRSIHNLNFDHRKAHALGGTSSIENIRLLCFHCNQRGRIRMKL